MESEKEMGRHNPVNVFIIIATVLIHAVVVTFNYLSSSEMARGIFLNSTGDLADIYFLEITPAGWTFGVVWGTIYVWMSIALIYGLVTLCRRGPTGEYLYKTPSLTPSLMYICICLNLISNISWIFLWDRQHIIVCLVPIALAAFFLYCAIFVTARATNKNAQEFYSKNRGSEYWLVTFLVHNALAFYGTWLTIATLLNFAIVLTYNAGVAMANSCTVVLSVLTVEILVWVILDASILDKYVRYIFTPHVVLLLGLGGSIAKNWNPAKTNSIFTVVLISLVAVFTVVKLVLMISRHKRKPVVSAIA